MGDQVLIFTQAQKAILYRPSANKIIEVAPINLAAPTPTPDSRTYRLVLYNGTKTTGLTKVAEKQITDQIAGFEVVDRDNASASAYVKNLIINLGNVPESRIGELKEVISGELSDLPQGEKKPDNADLLIILGNDYVK